MRLSAEPGSIAELGSLPELGSLTELGSLAELESMLREVPIQVLGLRLAGHDPDKSTELMFN